MKTRKLTLAIATMLLASAAFVSSCKKKTTDTPDTDTTAASDNNLAETTSNDIVAMTGQASEHGSLSSYRMGNDNGSILSTCATVTAIDTTLKKFTITFSAGCVCKDGRIRSGSLLFDFTGTAPGAVYYRRPGFKCVVTTPNNDYYVDGNKVTINKTITNTTPVGFNPTTTNMTWNVTGNITIVKANNGGTVNWNCNRTKTLMNTNAISYAGTSYPAAYYGQNVHIAWDSSIVSVSGTANGTTAKGEAFNFSTSSPLVVNMFCAPDPNHPGRHPIVQGAFDFTPGTKATRHVDFGTGSCDLNYSVTISGVTYNLTMN